MTAVPKCTVGGNLYEILGDVVGGELNESALSHAVIEFAPNVNPDEIVTWEGRMERLIPIMAQVDTDGAIVNMDGDPVLLLAQEDGLNIRGLQWRVNITIPAQVLPPSPSGRLRSWWIYAGADGEVIDLGTRVPVVHSAIHPVLIQGMSVEDVAAAIAAGLDSLVAGAPAALDKLKELADAIGDDPDFATHVTTAIADSRRALYLPGQGRVTQIRGFGHSYMAYPNIALNQASDSYMARLAAALGVTNNNLGVPGGALMASMVSNAGGWQYVFNQLPRGVGSARDQIVILDYGIDDIVQAAANGGTFTDALPAALASVLSRIRATPGSIKLANDSSIAFGGGGWTYDSGATFGVPVQYSFTSGNTYTITVPSTFPGGTLCVDLLTAVTDGATHTFTLDGSAVGSINIIGNSGGSEITPSVFRIPGAAIGAHTIVGTISNLTGAVTRTEVVGWHHETSPLPVVFCLKQPTLIKYTTFGVTGRPTDTTVGQVNSIIDTVAASFDANVVTIDRDSIMAKQQALYMYYDGLTSDWVHPGPLGHKLIASVLRSAINAHPAITDLAAITQ